MLMRDRLIELVSKAREKCNLTSCCDCEYRDTETLTNCYSHLIADHLIANGVLVPPCKEGTKVYCACLASGECVSGKVLGYSLNESGFWAYCNYEYGIEYWHPIGDFGKTVFLTREEAEQALKGERHAEIH